MATAETTENGTAKVSEFDQQAVTSEISSGVELATTTVTDSTTANALQSDPSPQEPTSEPAPAAGTATPQAAATGGTFTTPPPEKRWPGWPGDCVFRLIVPVLKVGSIIGRKGELIKKMCEETRARIRVLDGAAGTSDRIVSVDISI